MNEKTIKKLVSMQKQFAKIYASMELCGVHTMGVQLCDEAFAELMQEGRLSAQVVDKWAGEDSKRVGYQWEASGMIDGVRFYTVGSTEDFQASSIPTI